MRVARVLESRSGGPFERSMRALEKQMPHCRTDVQGALSLLVSLPHVPFGKMAAIVPGMQGCLVLKVRVGSRDLGRGRSGGIRLLLAHVRDQQWQCVLAYSKSKVGDVPRAEILKAVEAETDPS